MIELHKLSKTTASRKKRLGRGHGSGRGKTAGRGTKGQGARNDISQKLGLAGKSFLRRLPLYRGKFRNKPKNNKLLAVNVKYLNVLPTNSIVDLDLLIEKHIVEKEWAKLCGVKILGDGNCEKAFIVKLPCSKGAIKKIEAAGGKVEMEKAEKKMVKSTDRGKKSTKKKNG